ncbi:hypothetical protein [Sporomusa malonica]|uniref:Uncharacterized protein n=1 Tax=Sporomusa malonica TaxID=112901 RepID=A0A1W2AU27_9FIRM|nr:hypothetical protein [Sporomusa malonica]SMC64213.1 hypothetical protein SAMN04488500_106121 [Sporomusa malonica]
MAKRLKTCATCHDKIKAGTECKMFDEVTQKAVDVHDRPTCKRPYLKVQKGA